EAAGFRAGDIVLTIDGLEARRNNRAILDRLAQKIGQSVKAEIMRDGQKQTLEWKVAADEQTAYKVIELPSPNAEQVKTRERWLKRS
ncbi:MAG TPA: PDZ domain-containing protein, partial [Blastocatellia bacterium]|nr:PDZ domain-containing protein [Blastocatellia bacterium]